MQCEESDRWNVRVTLFFIMNAYLFTVSIVFLHYFKPCSFPSQLYWCLHFRSRLFTLSSLVLFSKLCLSGFVTVAASHAPVSPDWVVRRSFGLMVTCQWRVHCAVSRWGRAALRRSWLCCRGWMNALVRHSNDKTVFCSVKLYEFRSCQTFWEIFVDHNISWNL